MKVDIKETSWGFEGIWANTPLYSGRTLVIKEGERTPYIYHKRQDITIAVLQGLVHLTVEGASRQLNAGDIYHIRPKIMYRFHALKGDATLLEAGTKLENDTVTVEG